MQLNINRFVMCFSLVAVFRVYRHNSSLIHLVILS